MAKKTTKKEKKKNEEKIKTKKERREKEEKKKSEEKREEKRKREKERREKERKKKNKIQKKLNKLNARKKEGKIKEGKIEEEEEQKEEINIKQLKIELKKENNTTINNNMIINIRTPSNSSNSKKSKSESSSKSYLDNSSYWGDFDVSIPEIPKHPERDDTCKSYTPTALPYENVLINRDFLRGINKQLKEKNFIIDNKYSFRDFCLYYKLKTYFKTNKEEKETYPNILKYLKFIKEYKRLEYENRFLKEYNKKIYCAYKKEPCERTYKKKSSSSSSSSYESDDSILSYETIKQKSVRREKMGPESERIRQEVDSFIKKIEDKKRKKDGKLRKKRKRPSKDWIRYINK